MAVSLEQFKPAKDYLICVDSDGCAVDTMDIKHKRCFGPCLVVEWGLERWKNEILARWDEINLYSMTRGINRFKGLVMMLKEVDARLTPIEGLFVLKSWVDTAKELSNPSLEAVIQANDAPVLKKALNWSYAVNRAIAAKSRRPFPG